MSFPGVWRGAGAFFGGAIAAMCAEPLEYNRDIRPILADNCFNCHGQDAGSRKAQLRLDDRAGALRGGKSGSPAIVPGNPAGSELLARVRSPHDDEVMPPADRKERLKAADIERLERWIANGAPYQPHWAFIPPAPSPLPAGNKSHPIDLFVAARRNVAGLAASPEADPETLVRRLWLDVVGLPPPPAEVDAFVLASRQDREGAWRAQVETLLASPRYGEKWARHWLDVARYADSDGYEKDAPRQQWAWRDWVIRSLNEDKPYDRFVVEQIAGDLLIRPQHGLQERQDLVVATGFLRNSMESHEGAIVAEQYRKEAMFDRMDCIGKAVIGLTLQCAQCHTHKFDPITQEDYFRLFAAIDNTYEATSRVYSPEKLAQIARIQEGIADAEARVRREQPDWAQQVDAWADRQQKSAGQWQVLAPIEPTWAGGLAHPDALPDHSVITLGYRPRAGQLSFTAKPPAGPVYALRLEALTHGDLVLGGPGRSIDGLFAVTELTVESRGSGEKIWKKHAVAEATADFESPDRPIDPHFNRGDDEKRRVGPASFMFDGKDETAWSPDRGRGRRNAPVEVIARFQEMFELPADAALRVTLHFKHGGKNQESVSRSQLLGRFRCFVSSENGPSVALRPDVRVALSTPAAERTDSQRQLLFEAWRAANPALGSINTEMEALWRGFPAEDTTVLHLAERRAEDARPTFLLDRGAWDRPKGRVTFGTPAFLPPLDRSDQPSRLAFARWLVDGRSPTVARVAVNRVWRALFGAGLVETSEDFGIRADPPAQPEVLDWLATEFMARGWSQKALLRAIVTSATYRQSSLITPELLGRDPRNRLLARGPRFRVEAEVVRDIALSVSGLLTESLGGPSIFPPVPESMFAESYLEVDFWKTAMGPERYRRSLYVFRRRSMPDPMLASFDAPNGDAACAARIRSNTPLAALAGLNEPVFVEAARALALRVLREADRNDGARAVQAFRLCVSRAPRPGELEDILALVRASRARMSEGWIPARVLAFGEAGSLPELPTGLTPNDAAAWMIAARVLLNLDETLSKN